ncbi:MAG TPA: four helix bundle protein [Povalibacter sp.]|jgi:four helix bundle protein|nr:four helix bundle protein [Povalibacter sp.]
MRDHNRLRAFELADKLVVNVYRESQCLPRTEEFGLKSQIRRAAVSVTSNIVEGCARNTETEYLRFLDMAYGSIKELEYQIGLCGRLDLLAPERAQELKTECAVAAKSLCNLIIALRRRINP